MNILNRVPLSFLFYILFTLLGIGRIGATDHEYLFQDSILKLVREASVFCDEGNYPLAETTLSRAIQHYDFGEQVDSLYLRMKSKLGWYKTLLGKYTEAEQILKSNDRFIPDSLYSLKSNNYMYLSSLYGMQQLYDSCKIYTQKGLENAVLAQDTLLIYHSRANMGDLYFYTGQYEDALAEYYEVRRLSVLLKNFEAASLGNLAIVHHKLGKKKIAEQYYVESLKHSKKEKSYTIYAIVLSEYCDFLIENGHKIKARRLLHQAIEQSSDNLFGEYNKTFLRLLYKTSDAYYPILGWGSCLFLLILIGLICLLWRSLNIARQQRGVIEQMEQDVSSSKDPMAETDINDTTKLIGLTESYPIIQQKIQNIKLHAGEKSAVVGEVKELEVLLQPLDPEGAENGLNDNLEKNNAFVQELKKQNPDLSISELKLCLLVLQGMTTKEIAVLTNRSIRGVESAKFRMRKKMGLTTQENLYNYLLNVKNQVE